MKIKKNNAFTLLELMIVMGIIAIIALIALPSYKSYMIKSQMEESLVLTAGAKASVIDYFTEVGDFPDDNEDAAYDSNSGRYVESIKIDSGTIIAKMGNESNLAITGATVRLTPFEQASGNLRWYCSSTAPEKYVPSSCKDTAP